MPLCKRFGFALGFQPVIITFFFGIGPGTDSGFIHILFLFRIA